MTAAPATARDVAPGLAVEIASWRPVDVVHVDGWQVGRTSGFTRRANSVAALAAPADPETALDRVEELYAATGLPSIVRVCSTSAPGDLDGRLAARGYAPAAPTQVMAAGVAAGPDQRENDDLRVSDRPDESWLRGWLEVKAGGAGPDLSLAARLLTGAPAVYLAAPPLGPGRAPAGVIRAAHHGGWVALSCLTVAPDARRRGLGRLLTLSALRWARTTGAGRAFLQVEESNAGAVALYASLGFAVVDRYHYRQR